MKNICDRIDATTIQQLYKLITAEDGSLKNKDIFPVNLVQTVFDGITGTRLDQILALCNSVYIPYAGTSEATRLKIGLDQRRKGLIVTFRDLNNYTWTQRYKGEDSISDEAWQNDENWEAWDFDSLLEDIKKIIEEIFNNIENYPDLIQNIKNLLEQIFNKSIEDGKLRELITEILERLLPDIIGDSIYNFFHTQEGHDILVDIINEVLDGVIQEYIKELQQALLDNERVTANALARHELAITEIQNQLLSQGLTLKTDMMIPYNVEQYNEGETDNGNTSL